MLPEIVRSIIAEPSAPSTHPRPKRFLLRNLALHFRPTRVPRATLRLSLTWGLGGMAATLIVLQLATGVLLKFAYTPTPVAAYTSLQTIISAMPFGLLIRNLHHWGAHLLVAVVLLHMLRVFFTGAFHAPRQFNWVVGLGLLGTVLLANFTGYLLPWDQLAFWAVTVSTGMLEYIPFIGGAILATIREGPEIGPATLQIFYAVHTAVVPVVLLGMMAFHFWRVRKSGGLVLPRPPALPAQKAPEQVPVVPHLLLREIVAALVVTAGLLVVSAFFDAPLGDPANPGLSPNPTRAPWYFAGMQELLLHLHPVTAVCLAPLAAVGAVLAIPYLPYGTDTAGIWFASFRGRRTAGIAAVTGLALTPLLIVADDRIIKTAAPADGAAGVVTGSIAPTVLLIAVIGAFYWFLRNRLAADRSEAVQAIFVLLLTGYAVLTVTGVWFRGPGMVLTVPW